MGSRLLTRVAAAAVLAVAVFPSSAGGATVSASGGVLTVRDTGAVVNQIDVEPWTHESDGILITERGPTLLTAGGGCILWDEDILHPRGDMVFCSGQFFDRIVVDTGDGSDSIRYAVESSPGTLLGGAGDDVLTAALGEAELRGGSGDDILRGLDGNQLLAGDEGIDTVDYTGRGSDPVDVSLDGVANDGIRDFEFDNVLPSTENVRGSFGGGVIVGSAAANRLEGGVGNDEIDGGAGADVLLGFAGDDILVSADGKRDVQVDCGIGLDSAFADHQDPLGNVRHPGATCESVSYVKPRDLASPGPG